MLFAEKFEIHKTLNPLIWDTTNNTLKQDVQQRLIEIVEQFKSTLEVPLNIIDIHIVGSQASYNYTEYSDLDVHIITNFELLDASSELLQAMYNAVKAKFNADYDITVKGIDVELYVEDIKSTVVSNGIYSLYLEDWIKFPQPITNVPQINIDKELNYWRTQIDDVIATNHSDKIESTLDAIYLVRKNSLDADGEYGPGNQLFKELRNTGYLDKLKDAYKFARSKELTLESKQPLHEDSRNKLLSKSKQSKKGMERFKRRVKSRIANSVKQYNAIDMNKLFKEDILTVDVLVKGETDTYTVTMSFGGFLRLLKDQLKKQDNILDYKAVTRSLIIGFNKDDVYIHCSCPDATYRMNYWQTRNQISSGDPENRPSNITNPNDTLGSACKHVLLVLSNTSWIMKVASVIYNYINYMEKHYQKLYANVIYPAIYGKKYEEPVQLDIFDDDTLSTDKDTIERSNVYARTKNQFQKGNQSGVQFASKNNKPKDQLDIDDASQETPADTNVSDTSV